MYSWFIIFLLTFQELQSDELDANHGIQKPAKKKAKNLRKFLSYKKRKDKKTPKKLRTAARHMLEKQREDSKKLVILSNSERKEVSLQYLRQWSKEINSWSFKKPLQNWLLNNCLIETEISKADFEIFKEYIFKSQGSARDFILKSCRKTIASLGSECFINSSKKPSSFHIPENITSTAVERAQNILDYLEQSN